MKIYFYYFSLAIALLSFTWCNNVFAEKADSVDESTLEELCGVYSKDKNGAYYERDRHIIAGADLATFEAIACTDSGPNFAKDKNSIYYADHKLHGIDHDSFSIIKSGIVKDSNGIYSDYDFYQEDENYWVKKMDTIVDIQTIEYMGEKFMNSLDCPFYKDKDAIYSLEQTGSSFEFIKLQKIDPQSFVCLGNRTVKDKYNEYTVSRKINLSGDDILLNTKEQANEQPMTKVNEVDAEKKTAGWWYALVLVSLGVGLGYPVLKIIKAKRPL